MASAAGSTSLRLGSWLPPSDSRFLDLAANEHPSWAQGSLEQMPLGWEEYAEAGGCQRGDWESYWLGLVEGGSSRTRLAARALP